MSVLELRPNCECCGRDLAPDQAGAFVCSFECTYCAACATTLKRVCPTCGGGLEARPVRPTVKLAKDPASTKRVVRPGGC